jgi:hypothetical protein
VEFQWTFLKENYENPLQKNKYIFDEKTKKEK